MASDDPTAVYARAIAAYNAAHEELVRITVAAQTWAVRLNETPTPHIEGTPVDTPFRSSRSLHAKDWPSARAIAEAVLARHRTAEEARERWAAVPEDLRGVLTKPPKVDDAT